jgi:S1-C subfamily serine protease
MRGTTPSFKTFHQLERIRERFREHGEIIGSGSGVVIARHGLVLTASHVVKRGAKAKVVHGSDVYPAKIVKRFPDLDVLLLQVISRHAEFEFSELLDCRKYPLGMAVFSVGYPNPEIQGYFPKLTKSYISASCGFLGKKSMVQFTADEGAGSSGAGLFDEDGRIVGVVIAMLDKSNDEENLPADISFATKSGCFYGEVSKYLPIPIKTKSAKSRKSVIETATRSSVLVLASA